MKEFVGLSPETMLGVPVKRPRYYLLARRKELFRSFDIDGDDPPWMSSQNVTTAVEDIAQYFDKEVDIGLDVEEKKIKYWKFFDVVNVRRRHRRTTPTTWRRRLRPGTGKRCLAEFYSEKRRYRKEGCECKERVSIGEG